MPVVLIKVTIISIMSRVRMEANYKLLVSGQYELQLFFYLVAYLSSYHEKAINAMYELA